MPAAARWLANCKEETSRTCHCCAADFYNCISINTAGRCLCEPCGKRQELCCLASVQLPLFLLDWRLGCEQTNHSVALSSLGHTHKVDEWLRCSGSVWSSFLVTGSVTQMTQIDYCNWWAIFINLSLVSWTCVVFAHKLDLLNFKVSVWKHWHLAEKWWMSHFGGKWI